MNKLIITNVDVKGKRYIFCGLRDDKRFYQVNFVNREDEASAVGNVYVGKVKDVAKNISAAFIEYKSGCTGYFSLEENRNIIFLNKKNTDKVCVGDEVIVQIQKAAVKTKFLVLSSEISFAGKNIVLNVGKSGIGFSGKIKNNEFKKDINEKLSKTVKDFEIENNENYGLIIRTNAEKSSIENLSEELRSLIYEWIRIKETAETRTCFSLLKKEESQYLKLIKGAYEGEISEVVTDDKEIFDEMINISKNDYTELSGRISLHNDKLLPLYKLYSIESIIEEIISKRVWLKSGAYLVIEPTEALNVIDVNTGKCIKGKKLEETIYKVNIEAAEEIVYQMRLRNLSGIVMIDFINMDNKDNQKKLMNYMSELVRQDKIKTTVVDMTKLNLVEITRKKIDPPVYEQIK